MRPSTLWFNLKQGIKNIKRNWMFSSMKKRVLTMHDGVIVSDEKEGGYHEA